MSRTNGIPFHCCMDSSTTGDVHRAGRAVQGAATEVQGTTKSHHKTQSSDFFTDTERGGCRERRTKDKNKPSSFSIASQSSLGHSEEIVNGMFVAYLSKESEGEGTRRADDCRFVPNFSVSNNCAGLDSGVICTGTTRCLKLNRIEIHGMKIAGLVRA